MIVSTGWFLLLLASQARAGNDAPDAFQKYAKKTAASYDIRLSSDGEHRLVLRDDSVLRWTNPVEGRQAHGEVFLWTDRGRPAVVLSVYRLIEANVVLEDNEFSSLALGGLAARCSGRRAWSPTQAGIEFKPFPEATAPQNSAQSRLAQMRRLAGQLRADKTTREEVTRDLRLLSNPVYRYESSHPEVLDGALFAFVEGTDPEVIVAIEARASANDEPVWEYGLARMNSLRLRVRRGDDVLWEGPAIAWEDFHDRTDKPYTVLRIR